MKMHLHHLAVMVLGGGDAQPLVGGTVGQAAAHEAVEAVVGPHNDGQRNAQAVIERQRPAILIAQVLVDDFLGVELGRGLTMAVLARAPVSQSGQAHKSQGDDC